MAFPAGHAQRSGMMMKLKTFIFLAIVFFVVLPHSAFADMMARKTPGDMFFFIVEVYLAIAFVVSFVLWITTHLIKRISKGSRLLGYTTLTLGGGLCLSIILGTIYYHYVGYGAYNKAHKKMINTCSLLREIETNCNAYAAVHNKLPESKELVISAFKEYAHPEGNKNIQQGDLVDSWGTPIKIKVEGEKVAVRSAGPDRIFNTKDDLTNTSY
jgi:hypothetical protein